MYEAEHDANKDEGAARPEGERDRFTEEKDAENGGGQGLNGVECRTCACFSQGKAFVPEQMRNACAHDGHVQKRKNDGGIPCDGRMGKFDGGGGQRAYQSHAHAPCRNDQRMIGMTDFSYDDGNIRPDQHGDEGKDDTRHHVAAMYSADDEIDADDPQKQSRPFLEGELFMKEDGSHDHDDDGIQ